MGKGLKIAAPPPRPAAPPEAAPATNAPVTPATPPIKQSARGSGKFDQVREGEMVQFNKRVKRGVADGYEMLAVRSRKRVPELLAEGLELLEQRYGKV